MVKKENEKWEKPPIALPLPPPAPIPDKWAVRGFMSRGFDPHLGHIADVMIAPNICQKRYYESDKD